MELNPESFEEFDCNTRNTLQLTATHCNTLQHTATRLSSELNPESFEEFENFCSRQNFEEFGHFCSRSARF